MSKSSQKCTPPESLGAVVEEIGRLKALYAGFHARELVRIVFYKLGERIGHKTAQRLWQQSPVVTQEALPLGDYHTQPDRYQARLQVIKLYAQGWEKISISRFLHVSRPTVDAWIKRFATEHFAGLLDKSSAPKAPARKVWLPLMIEVYHIQKRHPDAGKFRIWRGARFSWGRAGIATKMRYAFGTPHQGFQRRPMPDAMPTRQHTRR